MNLLLVTLKTLVIAYAVMVGVLFLLQRALLYPAQAVSTTPEQAGLPDMVEGAVTTADNYRLRYWFAPPRDSGRPVVVLFHGNASCMASRAQTARTLLDKGYGVLLASYRGYDGNPGAPSEQGLYKDARAQLDYVKGQGYPLVLIGQSLGSGIAVQMATEYPVRALVLETPYTSMADTAAFHYPFVPVRWLLLDRYDSLSKMAQVKAPVLVIQGTADEVIPQQLGQRLFEAASQPKEAVWVNGASHNNIYQYGNWPQVLDFIARYEAGG